LTGSSYPINTGYVKVFIERSRIGIKLFGRYTQGVLRIKTIEIDTEINLDEDTEVKIACQGKQYSFNDLGKRANNILAPCYSYNQRNFVGFRKSFSTIKSWCRYSV